MSRSCGTSPGAVEMKARLEELAAEAMAGQPEVRLESVGSSPATTARRSTSRQQIARGAPVELKGELTASTNQASRATSSRQATWSMRKWIATRVKSDTRCAALAERWHDHNPLAHQGTRGGLMFGLGAALRRSYCPGWPDHHPDARPIQGNPCVMDIPHFAPCCCASHRTWPLGAKAAGEVDETPTWPRGGERVAAAGARVMHMHSRRSAYLTR